VALWSGVKAGVRELLGQLDPQGARSRNAGVSAGPGLFDRSLRRYQELFKRLTADGAQSIVFGPEFVRAYADALGTERRRS
jgi:predicted component of type VI protein secretion system